MDEQTSFVTVIATRLDALQMPYMVSGSVALNFYIEPRMTRDVDVVVDMHEEDIDPFSSRPSNTIATYTTNGF